MLKYEVYYRIATDNRAPETVNLQADYRRAGLIIAENRRRVEHLLLSSPESTKKFVGTVRQIQVGDVVIEYGSKKQAWIYTPIGSWATVKIVND